MEPAVRLIPLGGLGEIGLNMMLVEFGDDVIAVDCGLMFPDDELPGIDYVIPDFSYALARRRARSAAVVLTHGHEDHIGALPYLLARASRARVRHAADPGPGHGEARASTACWKAPTCASCVPARRFTVGPFRIEPIRVTHSIVDGIGLAIDTPAGTVVHTGDFKLDPSPVDGEPAGLPTLRRAGGPRRARALLGLHQRRPARATRRSELEVGAALAERFAGGHRAASSSPRSPRTSTASSRCST